uniref:WD_REPEATS_REGION domain-containing protein n=2 Tax=Mesocestoides corti TaxID=53468 RepID=A0A5K3EST0_MESCO
MASTQALEVDVNLQVSPTADIWQAVALDASYVRQRALAAPHLTPAQWNLYLRRRYQLSRTSAIKAPTDRCRYISMRQNLLAQKYGQSAQALSGAGTTTPTADDVPYNAIFERHQQHHQRSVSLSSPLSSASQRPIAEALLRQEVEIDAPASKGYAFAGIRTIFDHHKDSITRIRFAHNDSHRLAIASADGTASICHISDVDSAPHRIDYLESPTSQTGDSTAAALMDVAWSLANTFVVTVSLDASLCLWDMEKRGSLARHLRQVASPNASLLVCEFHPVNNNYIVVGDTMGCVQVINLSTGHVVKNGRDKLHTPPPMRIKLPPCRNRTDLSHYLGRGCITALAFDPQTCRLWVGTDLGLIQAYKCDESTGCLSRTSRFNIPTSTPFLPSITSLSFCAWLSHEDSSRYLLVNAAGVGLILYRVFSNDGRLCLHRHFDLAHSPLRNPPSSNYGLHLLHSCFAPLISFRSSGSTCVVSASEERGAVYVFEVNTLNSKSDNEERRSNAVITCLQGHDCEVGRTVVDVALSWDENVLASADESGVVIIWNRVSAK